MVDCKDGVCEIRPEILTILCVLKTGGDYTREYVDKLYKGVQANLTYEHVFVCLSDDQELLGAEGLPYSVIPLEDNLEGLDLDGNLYKQRGYWSKIELFRFGGRCLYFDLDIVLVASIEGLADKIEDFSGFEFLMLEAFGKGRTACKYNSSVMGWNGNFQYLHKDYRLKQKYYIEKYKKWEQRYISEKVEEKGVYIEKAQDILNGIYSYKHHCKEGLPEDIRIVVFHGKPRPPDVGGIYWK